MSINKNQLKYQSNPRDKKIFCLNLKNNAVEARRFLEETYGEHTPSKTTCDDRFNISKDYNLQALFDEDGT